MTIINRSTFQPSNEAPAVDGDIIGTVEVTLGRETRRVAATFVPEYNWIITYSFIGRYHTSNKSWPARVLSKIDKDGSIRETVHFGRDDNHPKFRKENCIFFA